MGDNLTARDLMLTNFATIRAEESLEETMRKLLEAQQVETMPNAVAVVDADGAFEGLLTARLLARSLLSLWMPDKSLRDDEPRLEKEMLDIVQERLTLRVHDALIRGLPVAKPDARLLDLIAIGCDKQLEFIPVVEDQRILGVVPITRIFQATAALALTPEDEGIHFDQ